MHRLNGFRSPVGQHIGAILRLCIVAFIERRDRDPAFAPHLRRFGRQRSFGQEQAAVFVLFRDDVDQRIGIKRKAGGDFDTAVCARDGIGTAASECSGVALGKEREAEPALIFKAMPLGRVEGDGSAVAERFCNSFQRANP